ncbi:hypothetical protein PI126_g23689, partial [Phytophthora idaei]
MPKLVCDRAEERPEKRLRRQLPQGTATAGCLGGIVAFNDARAWLRSSGWYFKRLPDGVGIRGIGIFELEAIQTAMKALIFFLARMLPSTVIKGTSEPRAALFAPEKLVAIAAKDVSKVSVALRVCAVLGEVKGEGA